MGLACLACKSQKIRCDKAIPCTQCVVRGRGDLCQPNQATARGRPKGSGRKKRTTEMIQSDASVPHDQGCENCGDLTPSRWRKDSTGQRVCNACGLYFNRYGKRRPAHVAPKREEREIVTTSQSDTSNGPLSHPRRQPHNIPHQICATFSSAVVVGDHPNIQGGEHSSRPKPGEGIDKRVTAFTSSQQSETLTNQPLRSAFPERHDAHGRISRTDSSSAMVYVHPTVQGCEERRHSGARHCNIRQEMSFGYDQNYLQYTRDLLPLQQELNIIKKENEGLRRRILTLEKEKELALMKEENNGLRGWILTLEKEKELALIKEENNGLRETISRLEKALNFTDGREQRVARRGY
ncbi:hypothetical protein BT69DRAFT_1317816 [Atractiella rhizophila]|nr:hypothetical protein BT69DRAFT_1317816 [Atractiella rhizophila]